MDVRRRYWIETALACVSGFFFLLTLVWRDWIEEVFGWDPDQHNGGLEWALVVALLAITVAFYMMARAEKGRAATT
jgi:hypothetical protein